MFVTILAIILVLIFTVLSLFHFYWLFGGTWGLNSVIPSKGSEAESLSIPPFATLVVALGLLFFGLLYVTKMAFPGLISIIYPKWVHYAHWIIPSIFIIRAIGDFKYVGLFKSVKNTKFSKADSKLFAPLCLFIGIVGMLIQVMS